MEKSGLPDDVRSIPTKNEGIFQGFATNASLLMGAKWSFLVAASAIAIWALTGPIFKFSDTWQLVINTTSSIVTFLMVFLIQNIQNRDARAIHLKLDEIIHALNQAHNEMIKIEKLPDKELDVLAQKFEAIHNSEPDSDEHQSGNTHPR